MQQMPSNFMARFIVLSSLAHLKTMAPSIATFLLAAYSVAIVGICRSFGMQGLAAVLVVSAVSGHAEQQQQIDKEKFAGFAKTFRTFSGNLQELSWLLQAYSEDQVQEGLNEVSISDLKAQCSRLDLGGIDIHRARKEELVQIVADQVEKWRDLDLDQMHF